MNNYDIESFRKGLRNPKKIIDELKRLYSLHVEQTFYNKVKAWNERNASSDYGLIIHWDQYKLGKLGVAQTPFFIKAFIEEFKPIIITSQGSYERHKRELKHIFSFGPPGRAPKISFDADEDHKIAVLIGDPHSESTEKEKYIIKNNIDYVLSQYYTPFLRHFEKTDEYELVHFPWAVPEQFIVESNNIMVDKGDLVILGDNGGKAYETREWCSNFSFVNDPHREVFENKQFTGADYYKWLQQFEAVIAANSLSEKYRYITAKFFEIPAAGNLLFAQYSEDLERLGFSSNNCVIFDKCNFENRAERYLQNPEEYIDKRLQGVELIRSEHTIRDRIETIENIF